MKNPGFVLFMFFIVVTLSCQAEARRINLSGSWKFAADPLDQGMKGKWFARQIKDQVSLPGSMSSNGKGEEITLDTQWTGQIVDSSYFKNPEYAKYRQPGNIKIPFWLQSLQHYQGAAWYQKEVIIPESWKGLNIFLSLERCHWESRLWIDNREAGMRNSLGTPHRYELTQQLSPGKHTLTLCIDNRTKEIDPGVNSHSISDHTQTNWNGMIGDLYLEARSPVFIRDIQTFPEVVNKKITAKIRVANTTGSTLGIQISMNAKGETSPGSRTTQFNLVNGDNLLTMEYPMGKDMKPWNEFHPAIYHLTTALKVLSTSAIDTFRTTFGMREFRAVGKQLLVNGQPVFLRGTLECAIFPKTGYPPTSVPEWLRIFRICRAHGLNHMRFHSWCPPEAAFVAADQSGFYLQVECSSWCNQSTRLGDGNPFDKYLYEESQRMVDAYGNHPSFCMMAYGNEPGGSHYTPFLTDFVTFWKNKDNRRIYTSGAGWPNLEVNDYLSTPNPRIQGWGEGLKSSINGAPPTTDFDWTAKIQKLTKPVVSHEIGQWCVYPDFKEIPGYDGVLRARNFEIFRQSLEEHGMGQLADSFLLASGRLQALCYKAEIEAALRTPGFAGFQLLDLHDFPGQGTALVGVLNAFWEEKGYISPEEYSHFCNSTVPLARLKKRIFTNDEPFEASVEVAHYGEAPLAACRPSWKITDRQGRKVRSGNLSKTTITLGNAIKLGKITMPLYAITRPEKLTLEVTVDSFTNSWDFWVYPAKKEAIPAFDRIRMVSSMDEATTAFLEQGGSVLLSLKKGSLMPEFGGNIAIGFSSIFWNTAWTRGQAPHTLGILCNPKHPSLEWFPSEYHSNWQWWDAMSHSGAIDLTQFPKDIPPIVRVIDDWFTNRPLALLLEAKAGKGKIIISGIDLISGMDQRPEAQQLLYSLKKYMTGSNFNPETSVSKGLLQRLTKAGNLSSTD